MSKEELAALLNEAHIDRKSEEFLEKLPPRKLEKLAQKNGLIICFGESDDLLEFRGAIREEVSAYKGVTITLYQVGKTALRWHAVDVDTLKELDSTAHIAAADLAVQRGVLITSQWAPAAQPEYSWYVTTKLPHAGFDTWYGDNKFCRGIVVAVTDLQQGLPLELDLSFDENLRPKMGGLLDVTMRQQYDHSSTTLPIENVNTLLYRRQGYLASQVIDLLRKGGMPAVVVDHLSAFVHTALLGLTDDEMCLGYQDADRIAPYMPELPETLHLNVSLNHAAN